jgi:ornithine decarboxylase
VQHNPNWSREDTATEQVLPPELDPFSAKAITSLVGRYGSPLFIIDLERVRRQYAALAAALPRVDLHYALKPLPHESVVSALDEAGSFFDLATTGEVELVRRLGVAPGRCIHTHPIKREIDIRNALNYGVKVFVVDNPDEVRKFVKYRNRCSLLIRVSFRSPDAVCDLSRKFGCDPQSVGDLVRLASQLQIQVSGLSFHVGSQALDPGKHIEAIEVCRGLLPVALEHGQTLTNLDIGGGFPVDYGRNPVDIDAYCAPIRAALSSWPKSVRVIAEPGRFIVAPAAITVTSVMGRAERDGRWWYYLDDGLYGCFNGQLFDHAKYPVEPLRARGPAFPSVLAGPTCDSIDVVDENIELPKLEIGDLVIGRTMGAYTWCSATEFNFFPKPQVMALDRGKWLRQ